MQSMFTHVKTILEANERFCQAGKLFRNAITEATLKMDPELLRLLTADEVTKQYFFEEVENILIFDKIKFQQFISNKEFLPDSYTRFRNKIGLTTQGEYVGEIREVVLSFPYKDCVLKGGQTKEAQKRQETFWNKTLAPDEIDRLCDPKALTGWKKFDKEGHHPLHTLQSQDNYLIKGNNLLTLHSLKHTHRQAIKLIYIDPPYNTGKDSFGYNDKFNHSSWLTFMHNRLSVARDLIQKDGSIWVSLDDREVHYCKVMMDELFGRENFVSTIIWHSKYTTSNDSRHLSYQHENILVYAKDIASFEVGLLPRTEAQNKSYRNPDNDPRGPWKATPIYAKSGTEKGLYEFNFPNAIKWKPPKGCYPRYSKKRLEALYHDHRLYFNSKGGVDKKTYLSEVKQGVTPGSVWTYDEVGHTHANNEELAKLLGRGTFDNPKGTRLIKRIIQVGNVKDDETVLDFFGGSGTTGSAVIDYNEENNAHINFILCEQMDYALTLTAKRIQKSMALHSSNQSFNFCELYSLNEGLVQELLNCHSSEEIEGIKNKLFQSEYLHFSVDEEVKVAFNRYYKEEDLHTLKSTLLSFLDYNQLYVNLSEIEDADLQVDPEDIRLTKSFYRL